jgi:hypothetical protein
MFGWFLFQSKSSRRSCRSGLASGLDRTEQG